MIKLYDNDSYLNEFEATVTGCEKSENGRLVTLDQTAFFPTAGGQSCDTGFIDGQAVSDVAIENEECFHLTENPIETGKRVKCRINWEERFRKMQHHTAEHIVSGLIFREFGFENVGFHLNDREVTMDYSGELDAEQVRHIEALANEAARKNLAVTAEYPENPEKISYRSKLELTENIRLVTIDGIDVCACCAPHVRRTGEVGLIKIIDFMRHRGGVRMRMICGMDALEDYNEKCAEVQKISELLSAKQSEIAQAVEQVLNERDGIKRQNAELMRKLALLEVTNSERVGKNICVFTDLDTDAARFGANEGKTMTDGVVAILNGENGTFSYVIASQKVNLREFAKDMNAALNGRGGGNESMICGKFSASEEEIKEYFKNH